MCTLLAQMSVVLVTSSTLQFRGLSAAKKLRIPPKKCLAINFSRRCDPGNPPMVAGQEASWSATLKIWAIWISLTLNFRLHFSMIRTKALRRLNYIKAVASHSRGVASTHLMRIVNSLVRSPFEYGSVPFFDCKQSAMIILERIYYYTALRTATSFTLRTPFPVFCRESGAIIIHSWLLFLAKAFLLRPLALPPGLALSNSLRSIQHPDSPGSRLYEALSVSYRFDPSQIIRFI